MVSRESMNSPAIRTLAVLALVAVLAMPATAGADAAAGKKKELQRIKREMQEKKREIERAGRKERSVLADRERIDRAIQAGDSELADQQQRLREAEAALQDVEQYNSQVGADLSRLKWLYRERVRALYKTGRLGYAAAVLTSEHASGALKRVKYLAAIIRRDHELLADYRNTLDRLVARQTEAANRKEEIIRRKQAIEAKKKDLESQKKKRSELLASVRKEKGLYEQTLRELEESSASLWAMIKKAEQEKKKAARARRSPKSGVGAQAAKTEAGRAAPTAGRGVLPWPVDGQVVSRFGMQHHPQFGTTVFRRGIEIEARPGEQVRAVDDGQVAWADWYKGYGKLMIIEHRSGFYSLYGYLSRLDLHKGDQVAGGQVLGLAGDTGSMKGPRLYFEIRRNGEAQDPLQWLAKR
jgi:septal ring factor EnvC (AmiA/AmiB activator)